MKSDAYVLGFDTSAAHCAAALLFGDRLIAARSEAMIRGQAERLFPLLEEVLAAGGVSWSDLSALGVGIGPGNFTGIRIGVSAARGLSLSLGVRAVGVSLFEVIGHEASGTHLAAVEGPRDHVYVQPEGGVATLVPRAEADAMGLRLAFAPGAARIAEVIAQIAGASGPVAAPKPLYLKAADAAPARDKPPVVVDDLA